MWDKFSNFVASIAYEMEIHSFLDHYNFRTKWKRQTTAAMRAEQLRNHVCDEKDCPGAKRLSAEVTSFCPRCHVVGQNDSSCLVGQDHCHVIRDSSNRCHVVGQTDTQTDSGSLLPRVYLRHMQLHLHANCTG